MQKYSIIVPLIPILSLCRKMNSQRVSQKDDYEFNVLVCKNMKENIYIGSPVRKRKLPLKEGNSRRRIGERKKGQELSIGTLGFNTFRAKL